ncbi:hypothetical protein DTO271G3_1369 [Paecilomyces variotii]|nr:hypothetical protein DTO271G3_1369 [Paecilomyces variotii]
MQSSKDITSRRVHMGLFHEPETYHDPMTFEPERLLSDNGHIPQPGAYRTVFGSSRCICHGRYLSHSAVYLTIAKSLAVFNMGKLVDNGKEVDSVVEFQNGAISHRAPSAWTLEMYIRTCRNDPHATRVPYRSIFGKRQLDTKHTPFEDPDLLALRILSYSNLSHISEVS